MGPRRSTITIALGLLLLQAARGRAEDERTQFPAFLARGYFEVAAGFIDYPFGAQHLEPGFRAESVQVPHAAARVALFGYRFNEHLSAQINYMRPVEWVGYSGVNGVPAKRTVWMNLAGVTVRGTLPVSPRFALDAEAGLGIVTRHGFNVDHDDPLSTPVVKDANYWTPLFGGGGRYRLNRTWDLRLNALYAPSNSGSKQPHTFLMTGGFTFNMRPLSEERLQSVTGSDRLFRKSLLQFGYAWDSSGYKVNSVVSGGALPIFWGGAAQVRQGVVAHYHHNVFHTGKLFSLDFGASYSHWRSRRDNLGFDAVSVFPVFRFTPLRFKPLDVYLVYSLAGPTILSKSQIDGEDTGRHFTFQDFMGLGFYIGEERHMNAEVRIGHYSNGNLFPHNAGVSIPLTFSLGYAFH